MLSDRGASVIIYLVSGVWAANMIISMIPPLHYQPDPAIHGIFTVIVGGGFAVRAKVENRRENDGGDHRK